MSKMLNMDVKVYLILQILLYLHGKVFAEIFTKWSPDTGPTKENLLCPDSCDSDKHKDVCCACNSKHQWEISPVDGPNSLYLLDVEYMNIKRSARFRIKLPCSCISHIGNNCTCTSSSNAVFQGVIHTNGKLRTLPENTCNFSRLTHIDFRRNQITTLPNISCLVTLDTLILDYNQLSHLSNTTFIGLSNLRRVSLLGNKIARMDINLFSHKSVNIFSFNASKNNMKELDVSNIFLEETLFCELDYSRMSDVQFTNKGGHKLNQTKMYGSGDIDLSHITGVGYTHPLYLYTKQDPSLYKTLINYYPRGRFYMTGTPITCDCEVGSLLELSFDDFYRVYEKKGNNEYLCSIPESLSGLNVNDVFGNRSLIELFICNISRDSKCPKFCTCLEEPAHHRFVINCNNTDKVVLPKVVPDRITGYKYVLYFKQNKILHPTYFSYLPDSSVLDLSENGVTSISDVLIRSLLNVTKVYMSNHNLNGLPESIQLMDPEQVYFGSNPINCDCTNTWIGEWRRLKKARRDNPLFCKLESGEVLLSDDVTAEYLECVDSSSWKTPLALTVTLCLLIIAALFLFNFRLELHFFMRKLRQRNKVESFNYDAYISCDEHCEEIRDFVIKYLQPKLVKFGYSVFIPLIDMNLGIPKQAEVRKNMQACKSVIIVLSRGYETFDRTEYNTARNLLFRNPSKLVILLNYDKTSISKSSLSGIRTLRRLGHYIKVTERQRDIFLTMKRIVGDPVNKQPK